MCKAALSTLEIRVVEPVRNLEPLFIAFLMFLPCKPHVLIVSCSKSFYPALPFSEIGNTDSKISTAGILATARGRIAIAFLLPIIMSEHEEPVELRSRYITKIMTLFWPSTQNSSAMHGAAIQIIDRIYDLLFYLNEKLNGSHYGTSELYGRKIFDRSDLPYHWPLAHRLDFASFFGRWDYIQHHMSKESNSTQEDIERFISSAILGLAYVGELDSQNNCFIDQMNGVSNILLNYLPRSSNRAMVVSTAAVNDQVGGHSKWTILFASVSHLMAGFDFWQFRGKSLQGVIDVCKQVIETLMNHDAGADINMLLTYGLLVGIENQKDIQVVVKETLLAFVKRRVNWDLDPIRDIEAFLCDLGATDRRLFHGINYSGFGLDDLENEPTYNVPTSGLRLTHIQSDRLSHAYPHEHLRDRDNSIILSEWLIGLEPEDAMPTEPNPQAEDLVKLLLAQAS